MAVHRARRRTRWVRDAWSGRVVWARTREAVDLPVRLKQHGSLLLRELDPDQMHLQHNKVTNLRLATARMDGTVIRPGETLVVQPGRRQLHPPQGLRRRDEAVERRGRGRRRWRDLPAGQPRALDGAALAADRRGALRALLRPVPRPRAGAAVGRGLLDRLQLRRPRGAQRHRRTPSSSGRGSASATCTASCARTSARSTPTGSRRAASSSCGATTRCSAATRSGAGARPAHRRPGRRGAGEEQLRAGGLRARARGRRSSTWADERAAQHDAGRRAQHGEVLDRVAVVDHEVGRRPLGEPVDAEPLPGPPAGGAERVVGGIPIRTSASISPAMLPCRLMPPPSEPA